MTRFAGQRAADALDLQQLVADYCYELDLTGGLDSWRFFTADGRMEVGKLTFQGHEAMKTFYQGLVDHATLGGATRTTRHLASNLRIAFDGEDAATIDLVMQNFSSAGAPPVFGATTPTIVSDCRLRCRREADGLWRIAEFTGAPIFIGDDPLQNSALVR